MSSHTINHRALSRPLLLLLLMSCLAPTVEAHVKWFFPYDVTVAPMPIGEVLDGVFVRLFLVTVAGVYVFFLLDRQPVPIGSIAGKATLTCDYP